MIIVAIISLRKSELESTTPNFNTVESKNLDYNKPFEYFELNKVLKNVKGTSAGPDLIRYEMIQNLSMKDKLILLEFFNDIWKNHKFPEQWRDAIIVPILKQGKDPLNSDSYRPIALTNCLCKILERLVNNRLLFVLEKQKLLCPYQSGFRKKRCTYDNLTSLEHDIKKAFSKRSSVLAVFLDIQKAYDMTWRRGILQKLYDMGFRGNLPIFINNLLQNRKFRVRIGAELSDYFIQKNGVPQGSVISPTLFMILINDLLSNISPHLRYALYADDIVIWCELEDIVESSRLIQSALDKVGEWQDLWGTTFSPTKSNFVLFTRKRNIPNINLNIKGVDVPSADSVTFLGMIFDKKLRWHEHIKYLYDSCHKRLNILRSLQSQAWGADRHTLILIFKSYIRSKLDYGCHLYDSAAKSIKNKLNVIQNSALRLATGALRVTNIKKLEVEAHIPPLQMHREYMSFNYGLKIISNIQHPTRPCLI